MDRELLFTTEQSYPVLTGERSDDVALLLRRVGAASAKSSDGKPAAEQ